MNAEPGKPRRTRARWILVGIGIAIGLGGCGHTRSVGDTAAKTDDAAKQEANAKEDSRRPRAATGPKRSARPPAEPAPSQEGELPIATAPAALLKPEGAKQIQAKLVARGYLDKDQTSDTLDDRTRHALREFQRESGLPATGLPDDATVTKLGLDPGRTFRSAESGAGDRKN
jgi:hypothetical protein